MDLQVMNRPVHMVQTVLDTAVENTFDMDIHLPEYYPDIQRVLHCTVTPNIQSVTVGQDRIGAEGSGVMRMLYAAEDQQIVSFEQTFRISKSVSWKDSGEAAAAAFAKTDFVNCRASGQRKAAVHGVVSVHFRVQKKAAQNVIVGAQDPCLQMHCREVQTIDLTACAERCFAMSEVVEVGDRDLPIAHILRSHATVSVESVKAVKDKLLIKGELLTEIVYDAENTQELCAFRHVMPLSQIIEAAGVEENNIQDIALAVVSLETIPKTDSSGEQRLVEIAVRVQASVHSGTPICVQTVQDAYTTVGELQTEYKEIELCTFADRINDTVTAKQVFDLSGEGIAVLLDAVCGDVQTAYHIEEDTIVFTCETAVRILYKDTDGSPTVTEKQMAFTYRKIMPEKVLCAQCSPSVQISGCKAVMNGDGKIEVKLDILLSGVVYALQKHRLLVSAQVTEETAAQQTHTALTIYFSDPGEALWDIARRYKTTVEAIAQENALTGDIVEEKTMLLIPRG